MAGVNIEGAPSYTIPLDSLDRKFLSKYIHTPITETRPLWSRQRLDGKSEYCYVQIVTQEDDEDCCSEPCDTYKCHICNVHVPNMCYKEHNESAKHETMIKISQTILQRVSNQMNISVTDDAEDFDKDVYYCEPCSKIIKTENKLRHESSAYHIKSKKNYNIASEFYKIFKDNKDSDDENDLSEDTDEESDVEPDYFKFYIANNNNYTTNNDTDTANYNTDTPYKNNEVTINNTDSAIQNNDNTDTPVKETDTNKKDTSTTIKNTGRNSNNNDTTIKNTGRNSNNNDTTIKNTDTPIKNSNTNNQNIDTTIKDTDETNKSTDTTIKNTDTTIRNTDTTIKDTDTAKKNTDTTIKNTDNTNKNTDTTIKNTDTTIKNTDTTIKNTDTTSKNIDTLNKNTDKTMKSTDTTNNLSVFLNSNVASVAKSPIKEKLTMIPTVSDIEKNILPKKEEKKLVETDTFKEYLKEIIKKYNLQQNAPVTKGGVLIVAPNGDTVKVSQEHFHSYRPMKNSVYCQLCKLWISQDTNPHDFTESHVRNIVKPVKEDFTRTIDQVSRHCVLCNEVILKNDKQHKLSESHKKILKDTRLPKEGKTFCEDCNIYIDTHNFNIHMISRKHLSVRIEQYSGNTDNSDYKHFCEICNLTVPKYSLRFHLESKSHKAKQTKLPTEINKTNNVCTEIKNTNNVSTEIKNTNNESTEIKNKNNDSTKIINKTNNVCNEIKNTNNESTEIKNKNNDSAKIKRKTNTSTQTSDNIDGSPAADIELPDYCGACKVHVPEGGMKVHIDGKAHKKIIKKLVYKTDIEPDIVYKKDMELEINKVQSCTTPDSVAENCTTTNKVDLSCNNVAPSSEPSPGIATNLYNDKINAYYELMEFTDETKIKVRCKICFLEMFFVDRTIIEHMESEIHTDNSNMKKMETYNKLLFYSNEGHTKVNCEICGVEMPYIQHNVIEHMESTSHIIGELELLKFHSITKESSGYNCKCCDEDITEYLEHINSETHTQTFLAKYVIDRNALRNYVYNSKVINCVAQRHRERYRNLLKYNDIFKIDDKTFYCSICQINLCRISEIDHVLGDRHAYKLQGMN